MKKSDFLDFTFRQSKEGYNSTNEQDEALDDLMAAKDEDEEIIFYEIQDQSMSFGNAIIIMILFGLIGTDIDEHSP